jgi:hypothetical protein
VAAASRRPGQSGRLQTPFELVLTRTLRVKSWPGRHDSEDMTRKSYERTSLNASARRARIANPNFRGRRRRRRRRRCRATRPTNRDTRLRWTTDLSRVLSRHSEGAPPAGPACAAPSSASLDPSPVTAGPPESARVGTRLQRRARCSGSVRVPAKAAMPLRVVCSPARRPARAGPARPSREHAAALRVRVAGAAPLAHGEEAFRAMPTWKGLAGQVRSHAIRSRLAAGWEWGGRLRAVARTSELTRPPPRGASPPTPPIQ